jgi:UDP:flavonoid glycosyltransferase YjiC (YdhE family)
MIALIPNCGFLSETSRMLAIGRALQARGERVVFASHGGPFEQVIRDAGFELTVLAPAMDGARCARYVQDVCRLGKPGTRLQSAEEVRASVRSEVDFFRRHGAQLAVIGFSLTVYLSSRVVGIPVVASHGGSYVPPLFERGLAPVPTQMPMPGAEWLPAGVKRWMANKGAERLTDPVRFLNDVAAELGVEPVPTLAALMLGDLTLVTDVPEVLGVPRAELEAWRPRRPRAYRAGTRLACTGPLYATLDLPIPGPVQAALDGRRPTVLVVLSSSTPQMLRAAARRARASGARVIVGATIHDFGPVDDPDIVVAGLLPNHRVMPQVDAVISMGGQGTVQTAMCSGTPLVGIPLHPEQELNVDLAVRQGMALAVALRHADSERLTDAVSRLLAQPAFKAEARRVQGLYAGVDGAAQAADAIRRYRDEQALAGGWANAA